MKLIRYRDSNMKHYTYFWVDENDIVISPYFTDEKSANLWQVEYPMHIDLSKDSQ